MYGLTSIFLFLKQQQFFVEIILSIFQLCSVTVAKELRDRFGFEKVAITLRTSFSASDNDWTGLLYDGNAFYFSPTHHLRIVDRVGGGDSFATGLIYALMNGYNCQDTVDFAAAASALKHTIEGDFNRVSLKEVQQLMQGNVSGRIKR